MPKTNHVQQGLAYCFLINKIVNVPGEHIEKVCLGRKCPYFNGSAQGAGIECLWDDGKNDPVVFNEDVYTLRDLGRKTKRVKVSDLVK